MWGLVEKSLIYSWINSKQSKVCVDRQLQNLTLKLIPAYCYVYKEYRKQYIIKFFIAFRSEKLRCFFCSNT